RVPKHGAPVEATLVEEPEQIVPEGVVSHLARDGDVEPEAGKAGSSVQCAAAAMERDLVEQPDRPRLGEGAQRPRDHVRDEQAQADYVRHSALRARFKMKPCAARRSVIMNRVL